jgi:hypothetical protein
MHLNMKSIIKPKPFKIFTKVFCCYTNNTPQLQVIQIVNIPGWFFERVVFPKQCLFFEAPTTAELEVCSSHNGQGFLMEKIPVIYLKAEDVSSVDERKSVEGHK